MKNKIALPLLIVLTILRSLQAQVTQEWVSRYNGPGNNNDNPNSMAIDGSGNIYVTGYSYTSGTNCDYATIKYNSSGIQQWAGLYNGPGNSNDLANSIVVDASGNVYVTGFSPGSGTDVDFATIKYNSAGVQQWVQRYNGPGNTSDWANSIALDGSGNIYVTGTSCSGKNYWTEDYATIKYSSAGVQLWVQRYNGPADSVDLPYSLAVDDSGNVYVTGESRGNGTAGDYATIKYNSSGVQQWLQRYNGPGNNDDVGYFIALDELGNVYVTGGSSLNEKYLISLDYATIKYNSAGAQQWVQRYNGPADSLDYAYSLDIDASGNVYVTGESFGSGTRNDYATIKYNSAGVQQWVQRYNGPASLSDGAYSLSVDSSGNVYVTGYSFSSSTGFDYATIKYSPSGVQRWIQRYNGPADSTDYAVLLALDASGNIYVTGSSFGSGRYYDWATIKYSQSIGIEHISGEIPEEFSLEQNYPNPFNPVTKIRFAIPARTHEVAFVQLQIFDVLGREVETLVNEHLGAGIYEVDWPGDVSRYSSGVYYYTLKTNDFTQTKKMVLLR